MTPLTVYSECLQWMPVLLGYKPNTIQIIYLDGGTYVVTRGTESLFRPERQKEGRFLVIYLTESRMRAFVASTARLSQRAIASPQLGGVRKLNVHEYVSSAPRNLGCEGCPSTYLLSPAARSVCICVPLSLLKREK